MEHVIKHVEDIKGKKGELCKINKVRKHTGVILPYELLGTKRVTLRTCGKDDQADNSVSWFPM